MTDREHRASPHNMGNEHYPSLFRSADVASGAAQKTYLLLQRMHLGSLVLASTIGAFTALATKTLSTALYSAIAIVLVLGLLILWIARSRQDDKAWFDGRAIAESVKTATWRFMMKAQPFQTNDTVEDRFVSDLREIRHARPDFGKHLAGVMDSSAPEITNFMRQIRSVSSDERKGFYIESRVRDEKSWYSHKAKTNAKSGARWFWATAGLQAIAVTTAIIQAVTGGLGYNVVPVLTTCAAAVAAWSQMKRHDELAQAYALAAQELGELESLANNPNTAGEFAQFVEQVEETISREHTMWCARRDVRLSGRTGDRTG